MDLGLSGSVVAVFGAASGIGAAIARGFAAEGCVSQASIVTQPFEIWQHGRRDRWA